MKSSNKCLSCGYFDEIKKGDPCSQCESIFSVVHKNEVVGRCKRHAPTDSGFPLVVADNSCGDQSLYNMMQEMRV